MDENDKNLTVSPEEQKAEAEAQQEVQEDELREKLAEELGIDPDEQNDLLEKLVEREKTNREKLSGAIKQKISWRDKARKASENPKGTPTDGDKTHQGESPEEIAKLVDQKVSERLEARDIESLDLPDELKAEIRDLAKLKGISVREAANLPYIKTRKEEIEKEKRITGASPSRSKQQGGYAKDIDPSKPLDPKDFDLSTEEGRKAWDEARAKRNKWRSENNK